MDSNERELLTVTDDDGRWTLALPQHGAYELAVSAVGYFPESQRLVDCSATLANLSLRPGGAAVFGSARAIDGTPMAGVAISARSFATDVPLGRVVAMGLSDKSGRYGLACAPGDYVIEARYPGAVGTRARVVVSTVGLANFRVLFGGTISGHVRSHATAEPTPNAIVSAAQEAGLAPAGASTISTLSDGTGAFVLAGLWPGAVTLAAHAEGLTTHELTTVAVGMNEEKQGVELWLDRGYSISGSVRRNGDAPTPVQDTWLAAVDVDSERAWPASAASDEAGRFTIPGLPPGRYSLQTALDDSLAAATSKPIDVLDANISDAVVLVPVQPSTHVQRALVPEPAVSIHGRVVDSRLQPTPHVWLEVSSCSPMAGVKLLSGSGASQPIDALVQRVEIGDTGDFQVDRLSAGYCQFRLYDEYGRRPWARSLALGDGSAPLVLPVRAAQNPTLQLETPVCAEVIHGRALNAYGAGVPSAWVYAHREGNEESNPADSAPARAPAVVTTANGSFEVPDLCPGSYRVSVTSSDRQASAWRAGVRPSARLTLTLLDVSTVTGVVSYENTPVIDYVLTVAGPRPQRLTVRAQDGKYRLARLDSGLYEVLISSERGYALTMLEVAPGSTAERNFELDSWSSLNACVVDGSGRPLAGVDVQAVFEPPGGEAGDLLGPSARIRRAVTDTRGQFEIERVTAGRGYLALSRAGRELLIEGVPYTSQFGALIGPNPRLNLEVKRGAGLDLGVIHARIP